MTIQIVDASAAVELFRRSATGLEVESALRGSTPVVPAHFDAEVLSALSRLNRAGDLDAPQVSVILLQLERSPFIRYELRPLLYEAWSLRHNVAMRDALYVALARRIGGTLLTADRRLGRAPDLGVAVRVVGGV